MKTYCGRATVIIDLNFEIEAESLEDAERKIFEAECIDFELLDNDEKVLYDYETNNWYVVDKAQQGNIQQSGVNDFEIEELK